MAILRAGAFANTTDSFLNEPATAGSANTYPVNCAKDTTSANWPWKYYLNILRSDASNANNYSTNFPSHNISYASSGPGGNVMEIYIAFYCQCATAISFTLSYNCQVNSANYPFSTADAYITANGFVDSDSDSDPYGAGKVSSASISGSTTINLAKSVVPRLVYIYSNVSESALIAGGNGSITLSLS